MEKGLSYTEAPSSLVKGKAVQRFDRALCSLALLQRSQTVRRLVDLATTGVTIERIPSCLSEGHKAVLVSNYPSVTQTLRALIKLLCRLPGERARLKGIGRPEVVAQANFLLKALGIDRLLFCVYKDEAGAYRLHTKVVREVLAYLDAPDNLLWLSITGRTRGNGLLAGDLRTGAALFSVTKQVPILPMGLVSREEKGRLKVVRVRFGQPIEPPNLGGMNDFERSDLLIDFTKLVMCQTARLLPPGQRGDFEDVDEKLLETSERLGLPDL